jgi:hypothetical protein
VLAHLFTFICHESTVLFKELSQIPLSSFWKAKSHAMKMKKAAVFQLTTHSTSSVVLNYFFSWFISVVTTPNNATATSKVCGSQMCLISPGCFGLFFVKMYFLIVLRILPSPKNVTKLKFVYISKCYSWRWLKGAGDIKFICHTQVCKLLVV